MKDQGHQAMWPQMSAALAAIDEALGLPADGCNSTAQTLAAIKKLKDGRDAFQESLYAELDTNFRLRDLGGAQPDEPMTPFIERVIAERDRFRAALLHARNQALEGRQGLVELLGVGFHDHAVRRQPGCRGEGRPGAIAHVGQVSKFVGMLASLDAQQMQVQQRRDILFAHGGIRRAAEGFEHFANLARR